MDKIIEEIFISLWARIYRNYDFVSKNPSILAFSGGKDSRLLLEFYLFMHNRYNIPSPFLFHLAHNIRSSAQEQLEIQELFSSIHSEKYLFISKDIPKFSRRIKKSLEETGRIFRRKYLNRLALKLNGYITTGHHSQDYFETLMINFIRGGGAKLSTMPTWDGSIFRPLTLLSDNELKKCYNWIHNNPIQIWEDETNRSDDYLRNRIRKSILPFLTKEGLQFNRVFQNLHEEEIIDLPSKKPISYLRIPNETCYSLPTASSWKKLIDIHLRLLSLSPARRSTVLETFPFLQENKSFEYETKEFLLSKQTSGSLFLVPKNSEIFNEPKIDYKENSIEINWNLKTLIIHVSTNDGYHIGFTKDGLNLMQNNQSKKVSEIFRKNYIPKAIRKYIPIVYKHDEPQCILLTLWNHELENFPKDWKG